MQYSANHVATMALHGLQSSASNTCSASETTSEHLIFENVLGKHALCPPIVLHTIYAYIHIRHLCNPPSENLVYGPGICGKVTWLLLIKYSYIARLCHPYIQSTDCLGMGSLYPIMVAWFHAFLCIIGLQSTLP